VQLKNPYLRLVDDNISPAVHKNNVDNELFLEAEKIEALNGPNPYSSFITKHRCRPDRDQASAIGRLMGARVRAADGSMQPILTKGERAAIQTIKKRRKEWSQQISHIHRTTAAIAALAQNKHEPSSVISYGRDVFLDSTLREQLEFALEWLNRFAQEARRHDSCTKGPAFVGPNIRRDA
jgi:hypothetical protein